MCDCKKELYQGQVFAYNVALDLIENAETVEEAVGAIRESRDKIQRDLDILEGSRKTAEEVADLLEDTANFEDRHPAGWSGQRLRDAAETLRNMR